MTCVIVADTSPEATALESFSPYSLMKRRAVIWLEAPVVD
jgi:hypothetical protein